MYLRQCQYLRRVVRPDASRTKALLNKRRSEDLLSICIQINEVVAVDGARTLCSEKLAVLLLEWREAYDI